MTTNLTGLGGDTPEGSALDYLGREAPLAFKGQPALPTAGQAPAASASPAPGGTGVLPGPTPGPEGTTAAGAGEGGGGFSKALREGLMAGQTLDRMLKYLLQGEPLPPPA